MEYVPPSLKNKEICRNWGKCLKCLTHFKLTHLSSVSKTQSYSLNCMKKKSLKETSDNLVPILKSTTFFFTPKLIFYFMEIYIKL